MTAYKFTEDWVGDKIKQWESIVLPHFGDRLVNIAEIGVFEGRMTTWMLDNLNAFNYFAVDPFSAEYEHSIIGDEDREHVREKLEKAKDVFASNVKIAINNRFDKAKAEGRTRPVKAEPGTMRPDKGPKGEDLFYESGDYVLLDDGEGNIIYENGEPRYLEAETSDGHPLPRTFTHIPKPAVEWFQTSVPPNPLRKPYLDLIYVDGSHVASLVLEDLVCAWPRLRPGGIMVMDDYLWKGPRADYADAEQYQPKIAIDAFLRIYGFRMKVLHKGRQVFVEKVR